MDGCDQRSVLVVDDDPEMLSTIVEILEAEGLAVTTAQNGVEALEALDRATPDVILLDMKMPVMDGAEFARHLHARPGPRVPVVVLSASEDARKSATDIGAQGWLPKPFEIDSLIAFARGSSG